MSTVKPTTPVAVPTPANSYPKHSPAYDAAPKRDPAVPASKPQPQAAVGTQTVEHRHAASAAPTTALSAEALSSTDVSYVKSLMGAIPAQKMEEILLKTGVPIPANLGPNIDTAA